jgi:hypothetical protein
VRTQTKTHKYKHSPTIPNDQTSDFLLYILYPRDSGAIQRIGPTSLVVYIIKSIQFSSFDSINHSHHHRRDHQYSIRIKQNTFQKIVSIDKFYMKSEDVSIQLLPVLYLFSQELVPFQNPNNFNTSNHTIIQINVIIKHNSNSKFRKMRESEKRERTQSN